MDLVLSNGSCCVTTVTKANDILLREDKYHPALHIEVCAEFCENFPTSTCDSYNYKKADFRGLYLALSHVDWTVLDSIPNPDEGVDLLYKVSTKEHISRVLWNCAALYFFWPNYVELLKLAN
jgi:hypothetical protein